MSTLSLKRPEDHRSYLIRYIEQHRLQGSSRNQMTIVFDGQAQISTDEQVDGIKVTFSYDETADDKIRRMVAQAHSRKNIVVVTNDRDIQYAVRALGARVCSVEKFLARSDLAKKSSRQKKSSLDTEVKQQSREISKDEEKNINAELENIWLKKDKT